MNQNYDRHVERMENWKDISEEKDWAFKARLVPLFLVCWEAPMPDVMLEFLNTFVIKGHKYILWASILCCANSSGIPLRSLYVHANNFEFLQQLFHFQHVSCF